MNDAVSFTVRNLPKPLHAVLTKLAAANRRSINAEVVTAIEGHVNKMDGTERDQFDRASKRCERCGGFGWSQLHQKTCVKKHSDDCPSRRRGGKCAYPCYMQPTARSTKRAKGKR